MKKNIVSTQNKGFQLKFENNLTISVQFGIGNYCENNRFSDYNAPMKNEIWGANNAEIAIWDDSENWFGFGSDTVKGYVNSNEVAKWIFAVSNAINIQDIKAPKEN